MAPKLICITGPDGAGKTTQIMRLSERLERQDKLKVAVVTIWDLLLDPEFKGNVAFKSPKEVDSYLERLAPLARSMFMFHCMFQALEIAARKKATVVLINSYWYKYFATEVAHGAAEDDLSRIVSVFPKPDLTFYLTLNSAEASERKAYYSGYETGFAPQRSAEAFVAFQAKALPILEGLAAQKGMVRISSEETIEAVTDQLHSRIMACLKEGEK